MRTDRLLCIEGVAPMGAAFMELPLVRRLARCVPVDALGEQHFEEVAAVLIPAHVDQRALTRHGPALWRHLERGGRLVFNGHVAHPCLPDLAAFVPLAERRRDTLQLRRLHAHPVFEGVEMQDLSFRKGVAGFYARGHNPMPEGAVALHGIGPLDAPADWLWRLPGGGELLMHSGNDLWMYAADASSARRIAPQLIDWLLEGGAP